MSFAVSHEQQRRVTMRVLQDLKDLKDSRASRINTAERGWYPHASKNKVGRKLVLLLGRTRSRRRALNIQGQYYTGTNGNEQAVSKSKLGIRKWVPSHPMLPVLKLLGWLQGSLLINYMRTFLATDCTSRSDRAFGDVRAPREWLTLS